MAVAKPRIPRTTSLRLPFTKAHWGVDNEISIIPSGIPGVNEIGPHEAANPNSEFDVTVWELVNSNLKKIVDVTILIDQTTKLITLRKAALTVAFDGVVFLGRII